jgi:hypothetical protein
MTDDALLELNRALGRIEGKLDGVVADQAEIKTRVGAVETKVSHILGWAAGAGVVASQCVSYLKARLLT